MREHRKNKKAKGVTRGVTKGAPSGFVISLLIHAAAFLLAGILVVFNIVEKEEKKFVPPKPVDRPKMELKKPKVKIRKTAKPKQTTRIVTKMRKASMPDLQLPEMSGMGEGLGVGVGGFEMMPDLDEVSLFGGGKTVGSDFVGTFYDFKRDRVGRPTVMDPDNFRHELKEFVRDGWRTSKIARYYRSPKKLYASTFCVPPILSSLAPSAFGEGDTLGYCWIALYKGQLVHHEDIRFRFWGHGDDVLMVRVDGEMVLAANWPGDTESYFTSIWQSSSADSRKYTLGNNQAVVGDWIELKAGEPLDMQVMIGEVPGGIFCSMLVVEVDGVEYPERTSGSPILPIFKTEEPSRDLRETIYADLVPEEASVTNGPVFRDYKLSEESNAVAAAPEEEETVSEAASVKPEVDPGSPRIWTSAAGKTVEAGYVALMGDKVVLKTPAGRQIKMPKDQFSSEDQTFLELVEPPEFNIEFTRQSSQRIIETSPYNGRSPPDIYEYVFGARLRQTSAGKYDHELTVEYFAVGDEADGNKFKLLDYGRSSFVPAQITGRSHEFKGDQIELVSYEYSGRNCGVDYGGYLVLVTDSRGVLIDHAESNSWLFENRSNLREVPVGRYFDETCNRVVPTRPTKDTRSNF